MALKRRLHILFVDDDATIVSTSIRVLEGLGHVVNGETQSLKALRVFSEGPEDFDLAILGHEMPDLSGLELSERFRRIRPGFPVILYSGAIDLATTAKIDNAGVQHVVLKRRNVEDLERMMTAAFKR